MSTCVVEVQLLPTYMKEGHCALMYCKHTGSTWSASHSISKSTVAHINVKFGIGRSSHTIMSFLTSACGLLWRTEHGTPCTAGQQVDDSRRILDGGRSRQWLMMSEAISHVLEHSECALGDRGAQD
jgi:hypothetical protein